MDNKYFNNISTLEELRKQYKELLKQHHPDNGGNLGIMQEINAEYDRLFKVLKNQHENNNTDQNSTKSDYDRMKYDFAEDELLREMLNKIINFAGIDIELIGAWIWVSGNTYAYKKSLKDLGFRWASQKKMWYWHSEAFRKKSRKTLSMKDIRNFYGSTEIRPNQGDVTATGIDTGSIYNKLIPEDTAAILIYSKMIPLYLLIKKERLKIMKNLIKFLEKNDIEYEYVNYGNPYYYDDGFSVQAVSIKFDYDFTPDRKELGKKEDAFLKFMKRKKKCCIGYSGRCGIRIPWYAVFDTDDLKRYKDHEARIKADVEKFWKEEHARRIAEVMKAAG